MPLDPLAQAFLDQLAATPTPKLWDLPPAAARQGFAAMMVLVGPKDVPIGKIENIAMPGPGGDIKLRVYTPVAAGGEALPAIVFFHGGGFMLGDLDSHDGLCRILAAESGARVIAVDYRLAPEIQISRRRRRCLCRRLLDRKERGGSWHRREPASQ